MYTGILTFQLIKTRTTTCDVISQSTYIFRICFPKFHISNNTNRFTSKRRFHLFVTFILFVQLATRLVNVQEIQVVLLALTYRSIYVVVPSRRSTIAKNLISSMLLWAYEITTYVIQKQCNNLTRKGFIPNT